MKRVLVAAGILYGVSLVMMVTGSPVISAAGFCLGIATVVACVTVSLWWSN